MSINPSENLSNELAQNESLRPVTKSGIAQLSDLKVIRDVTEIIQREMGLYIPSKEANKKIFSFGDQHRIKPPGQNVHTKGDSPVFFHSHPGNPNSHMHFIPSARFKNYVQFGSGDIPINNPNVGGMLNTVNPDGITLFIGLSQMPFGEQAAIAYLEKIERHGFLKEPLEEKIPTIEFTRGSYQGVIHPNEYGLFEKNTNILDKKGVAVFSITDKHSGKKYSFLSLSWEQVDENITDLQDVCFGTGLSKLAKKLGVAESSTGNSLREIIQQTETQESERNIKFELAMRNMAIEKRRQNKQSWAQKLRSLLAGKLNPKF